MKKSLILSIGLLAFTILFSCKRRDVSTRYIVKQGNMEVVVNNYLNAKKENNFEEQYSMTCSVVFNGSQKIEKIEGVSEQFYVLGKKYAVIDNQEEIFIADEQKFFPISQKPIGLTFSELIFNEDELHEIKEIQLEEGKRKSITFKNSEEVKVILLKPTDTVYSFSMSTKIEEKYKGRITNIQIYNRVEDVFTSIYVDYTNKIDKTRKDIIDFNNYLKNKQND